MNFIEFYDFHQFGVIHFSNIILRDEGVLPQPACGASFEGCPFQVLDGHTAQEREQRQLGSGGQPRKRVRSYL